MNTMRIVKHKQKLDAVVQKINNLSEDDLELRAHFSRYFCVLISGFVEQSMKTLLQEYCAGKSHPHISKYVSRQLKGFQNPKMSKILELLKAFNVEWANVLEFDDELKSAVDSVVENRNKIAHGEDVSLSFVQVQNYYKSIIKLIDKMEAEILAL